MLISESITFCGLLTSSPCTRQMQCRLSSSVWQFDTDGKVSSATISLISGCRLTFRFSLSSWIKPYCHVTEDTLISEMSKFETEESEKGVNRQIGVKVV